MVHILHVSPLRNYRAIPSWYIIYVRAEALQMHHRCPCSIHKSEKLICSNMQFCIENFQDTCKNIFLQVWVLTQCVFKCTRMHGALSYYWLIVRKLFLSNEFRLEKTIIVLVFILLLFQNCSNFSLILYLLAFLYHQDEYFKSIPNVVFLRYFN